MNIYEVMIEVTRKCNMKCPHCLRGRAQNKTISRETIGHFFMHIRDGYIGTLTITGGEPSLAPEAINDIRMAASMCDVGIGSFYIVTNAKRSSDNFIEAVKDMYYYCDDNEISALDYSNDQYHDPLKQHNVWKLQEELDEHHFLNDGQFVGPKGDRIYNLLNEGMAKEKQMGTMEIDLRGYEIEEFGDEQHITEGDIYLNVEGNIVPDCNLSYKSQKKLSMGNVFDDNFNLLQAAEAFNQRLIDENISQVCDVTR